MSLISSNHFQYVYFLMLIPTFMLLLDLSVQLNKAFAKPERQTARQEISRKANDQNGQSLNLAFSYEKPLTVSPMTISADKMNIFYMGVDNPITVAGGSAAENLEIHIIEDHGQLSKIGLGRYIVRPRRVDTVFLHVLDKGTGRKYRFAFTVRSLPRPITHLGGKTGGVIRVEELKVQQGLMVQLENFDFDDPCKVQGFTVHYKVGNQPLVKLINKGGKFNEKNSGTYSAC